MAKIITNEAGNKLATELKELIQPNSDLSLIVDQFSIYAFMFLSDKFKDINSLRILWTNQQEEKVREIFGTADEKEFKNQFLLRFAAETCADFFKSKAQIKQSVPGLKMLLGTGATKFSASFISNGFNSENLGLVATNQKTITEVKSEKEEQPIIDQYQMLFDMQWSQATKDLKVDLLKELERAYKDYNPEFLYQFTLSRIFEGIDEVSVDQNEISQIGLTDSKIWNELKSFQQDGVLGAIHKIKKYNGCILADSVGLGKTYEALAVIKYFLCRDGNARVLVLCPKKLRENWNIHRVSQTDNYFHEDNLRYDLLSHTDLSRNQGIVGDLNLELVNWGNFDLVVIDESHNFRNDNTRYKKLMEEVVSKGLKTKVLLLSATPVNNKMNDLKHQIYVMTENRDDSFEAEGIPSIAKLMTGVQREFNRWIEGDRNPDELLETLSTKHPKYFDLLDKVSIARCRRHIRSFYGENIHFPERLQPDNMPVAGNNGGALSDIEALVEEMNRLNLGLYAPITYLRSDSGIPEKYAEKYDNKLSEGKVFKQADREKSLIYLMRVNLLKRLESASASFGLTIKSILDKIDDTLHKIEQTQGYLEDFNEIPAELEDLREELSVGKKVRIEIQDMDLIKWKNDLENDKAILESILRKVQAEGPATDPKLNLLKQKITQKINQPINQGNKKVLIFTAFADTASYLYDHTADWAQTEFGLYTALVTGGTSADKTTLPRVKNEKGSYYKTDFNYLLTNFSPVSKRRETTYPNCQDQIDILIATDCVSEGQNLQDCDYLINYDIHWNPVRIVQRFGRIDRMGSINQCIQMVNFWPMDDLDTYIKLRGRVEGRAVMVNMAGTGGDNVIAEVEQELDALEETDNYRVKQLQELKDNKDVEIDDLGGGLSISDFTYNDFKSDLHRFLKENQEAAIKTPEGIHTILQIPASEESIEEGVIFCIKQRDKNNFLLTYLNKQGEVVMNYNRRKKILDICKKLCVNNSKVDDSLAKKLAKETKQYSDMRTYRELFQKAIEGVIGKSTEEGERTLYQVGGTVPAAGLSATPENYELVSFFILRK
ncbi:helicase domain-containing protein [Nitritalea halalkaliphila LW7]|uniref:Helicase domain-containing protein n=1 Tax=Nitritalea halalkaliphila LW7 TaxID=1189621 RepID=I5BW88_9BACT|nr:SNF2-related protein [Nitritalea halalkaliphila]EIM73840.1 helicase domain-containing protein [Nitritalea halalkaliphila LW7]